MIHTTKLPKYILRQIEEFDRLEKTLYPLKLSSFRNSALKTRVEDTLNALGVSTDCEYFTAAVELNLFCFGKIPRLLDPQEYNSELLLVNNQVAKINWKMAPGFHVIASDELGAFFLSNETGQIYDAAHYDADKLGTPEIKPVFACFYDLLEWYLDPDFEDWEDYLANKNSSTVS